MSDDRPWTVRFADILDAAAKIDEYTGGFTEKDFLIDGRTVDAVARNIIIIGEASARLDEDVRERFPDVPWGRIIGMRNRLVHEYFRIDDSVVWEVAADYVPILTSRLQSYLASTDAT